jgi:hypothetical protein
MNRYGILMRILSSGCFPFQRTSSGNWDEPIRSFLFRRRKNKIKLYIKKMCFNEKRTTLDSGWTEKIGKG